jgi:predicted dehydrogenase
MDVFSRREFLERSAILSAAAAAAALGTDAAAQEKPAARARAGSANDRLRVAVVGVHGRGMNHVGGYTNKGGINAEIVTVCDCDEAVIGRAMTTIEKAQGKAPRFEKDFRKLLDDKSVDAISIATPNHWHALMTVWGMQAGKHVYCEKPATHNVREGAIMTAAARKHNRVCQVGTQSRSNPAMRDAVMAVRGGKIGKADVAIGLCYKSRPSIGKVDGPQKPPATMDYDLWCGPAPLKMPHRNTKNGPVHYDWHWVWDYGNGDLGNQGVHQMDVARWGLNKTTMPNSVVTVGGRFGYVDDGETPNTELSLFDYGDAKMVFEVRGLKTEKYKGADVGVIWLGTDGMVVCPNYYSSGIVYDKAGKEVTRFTGGNDQNHFDNFARAVRSGNPKDLNCDIAEGHLSAALCHLANISYKLGAETPFDRDITCFTDCKEAAAALGRMKAHLKANGVDLAKAVGRVGPKLTIDPKAEQFTGSHAGEANPLLFREYRKGYELKESV